MRAVTYQHVLWGVARMLGMNPARDLNAAGAARLTQYIQLRYEEALRRDFWSELCVVESRTPDANRFIDYNQAGQTAIGRVKTVSVRHPERDARPQFISFQPVNAGIQLPSTAPTTVYVKFRLRPNVWTSTEWAAGAYVAGQRVYFATDGECYLALVNTNAVPGTDATKWKKLDFPEILAPFVIRAAGADALGDQKQNSRKNAELATAYQDLADAVNEDQDQQGQFETIAVDGYGRR